MTRLAILAAMLPSIAFAHDAPTGWSYPLECCASYDCAEIADADVTPLPQGWGVKATGETIAYEKTRRSPDGRFHRCSKFFANPNQPDKTICLFAPDMGF